MPFLQSAGSTALTFVPGWRWGAVEDAFGADIKRTSAAAEQAVIAEAQANKWKGDWVPVQVSATTGAAVPYTEGSEEAAAPTATPATPAAGTPEICRGGDLVPAAIPEQPVSGGGRAVPGAAPAPAGQLPNIAPPAAGGGGLVGLEAWWRLVLFLQGRLTLMPPMSGPVEP